jgi:drug/metabolite transporter (DMT)-like permease
LTNATRSKQLLGNGVFLGFLAAVLLAVKPVIIKIAYQYGPDATTLLALRMVMTVPFFILLLVIFERNKPNKMRLARADWIKVLFLGFTGYYAASFLDFVSLQYISVGLSRSIVYLNPAIVLLLSILLKQQKASLAQIGAMVTAYFGVVLVFWHEMHLGGDGLLIGTTLTLCSAVSYSAYLLLAGNLVERVGSLRLAAYSSGAATQMCLIQALVVNPSGLIHQPLEVYGLSLINATLCTVAPIVMVMLAIRRIGPSTVAQLGAIGPAATLFFAWILLGEPISILQVVGTLIVVLGIWLLLYARPERSDTTATERHG